MDGFSIESVIETALAGANVTLMLGVGFLAATLRWMQSVTKNKAILLPMVLGAVVGGYLAWRKPMADGAIAEEVILSGVIWNGVVATVASRLLYAGVAKLFSSTDDPPTSEARPPA